MKLLNGGPDVDRTSIGIGFMRFMRLIGGPADWGRRLLSEDMIVPFNNFSCFWMTLECSSCRATRSISPKSIGSDGTRRCPGLLGLGLVHSGPGGEEQVGLVRGVCSREGLELFEIGVSVARRTRGAGDGDIELSEKFMLACGTLGIWLTGLY